jgi:hypothetical protein
MNVDDLIIIIALESKWGDDFLVELSTRVYQPPLSLLLEGPSELPAALHVPMLVIKFNTELYMSGIHGFLENNTGYYLSETIAALEAIGAHTTARTMGNIRSILVRHGVDLSDRESIQKFHWDHWEESDLLRAEIKAKADNLTYAHPRLRKRGTFSACCSAMSTQTGVACCWRSAAARREAPNPERASRSYGTLC